MVRRKRGQAFEMCNVAPRATNKFVLLHTCVTKKKKECSMYPDRSNVIEWMSVWSDKSAESTDDFI